MSENSDDYVFLSNKIEEIKITGDCKKTSSSRSRKRRESIESGWLKHAQVSAPLLRQKQGDNVVNNNNNNNNVNDNNIYNISNKYIWYGNMEKSGGGWSSWRKRHFIIKPTSLLYYYENEQSDIPIGAIDLELYVTLKEAVWITVFSPKLRVMFFAIFFLL